MSVFFVVLGSVLAGALFSSIISILPALHVFNVMGGLFLGLIALRDAGLAVPPAVYLPMMTGLVVGWSMLNTIPSIVLGAPDESAMFTVLPGQKYLMMGRGYEGVMMIGVGGLAGVFLLVAVVAPLAPRVLPQARTVLSPHLHWMLWVIITFILMSEWPKGGQGRSSWARFADAWRSLGAGLLTFLLSGFLGFIVLYRSPVSVEMAFQNIMPAFVGLFAVPWCLFNVLSGVDIPPQRTADSLELSGDVVLRATAAGGLGGGFAAFFPVVTGGVGGLLAGHATAQRDERVFILSQGVSKLVYYTGALMFYFVPGLGLRRGGAAWMLQAFYTPRTQADYYMIIGSMAIAGAVSFLMLSPMTRFTLELIRRTNYRVVSLAALGVIVLIVAVMTGLNGLFVMAVATGIGALPVLLGSRRLNALGILLLPMACNMSGFGPDVARRLGLM